MKYQDQKLRQMLAAEYVLGTLTGRARKRFERLLRGDGALAAEARYWETRLAGLALRLKPVAAREVVWAEIDRQINANKVTALGTAQPKPAANLWRAWAIAASLACVGLGLKLVQLINAGPQIVELQKIVTVAQPMPYVAVLQPGGDARFMLSISPDKGMMKVSVAGINHPADYRRQCLELWVLDDAGKPHSLGVMPEKGEMDMPLPKNMPMPKKPMLAVSLEPKGGSPTGLPTGPVLTAGPAIQAL